MLYPYITRVPIPGFVEGKPGGGEGEGHLEKQFQGSTGTPARLVVCAA